MRELRSAHARQGGPAQTALTQNKFQQQYSQKYENSELLSEGSYWQSKHQIIGGEFCVGRLYVGKCGKLKYAKKDGK